MVAGGLMLEGNRPAKALTFFDKACALGDPGGCYEAGKLLSDAKGKQVDYPRAFVVLYRSCRQGYGRACTVVGALHREGTGTAKDATRAAIAYRNGCERKDPDACVRLGGLLVKPVDAASAFRQACQLGRYDGCVQLELLSKKGVKPAPELKPLLDPMVETEKVLRALPGGRNPSPFVEVAACRKTALEPSCVSGDLAVCQQAADLQENGGDGAAAYCMRRTACERGDGFACEQLGAAHQGGGLASSPAVALGWYEKGCLGGSATSCASAERLIETVESTSTPNQRATRRLDLTVRGCALEDSGGCSLVYKGLLSKVADPTLAQRAWVTLGRWCEKEKRDGPACTVIADRRKAIVLEHGCQTGSAVACREAAGLFPDPLRESALLGKACAMGDCESCIGRKTVEGVKLADARASQQQAAKVCPAECRAAAANGAEPRACSLGVRAMTELGGPDNERKAIGFAEEQCKRGFTCGQLAELFVVAEHLTPADEKRMGAVLDRACADGKPETCQARAELANVKPARELCSRGELDGCLKLGELLKLSNVELPQISMAWERACKLGSNLGCVRHWASLQTAMSRDSKAIEESHQKAASACDSGDLAICIELANHLKFRSKDPDAIKELKEVGERVVASLDAQCDLGDSVSCETAATFLQFKTELGGEARAKGFLRKACDHGATARCLDIAEEGSKDRNYPVATQYGGKACIAGSAAGCRLLVKHRLELTQELQMETDRALGVACGRRVTEACEIAADSGIPLRIESPAAPIPISKN
jgi:TPR repeat protein